MTPSDNPPLDGPDDAAGLLAEAQRILTERGRQYGPSADHHRRTAIAANAILDTELSARDVCILFTVDKLVRSRVTPQDQDHYGDATGYTALAYDHALRESSRTRQVSRCCEDCREP